MSILPPEELEETAAGLELALAMAAQSLDSQTEQRRVLIGFLGVLDALDRLYKSEAPGGSFDCLRGQMIAAFAAAGVTFFDSIGQRFDPQRHRAVEAREEPPGDEIVIEELTRGCDWRGQLLREACVIIATGKHAHSL